MKNYVAIDVGEILSKVKVPLTITKLLFICMQMFFIPTYDIKHEYFIF